MQASRRILRILQLALYLPKIAYFDIAIRPMMPGYEFWRKWLIADSVLILFVGAFLISMSAHPDPAADPFTSLFWKDGISDGAGMFYAWAFGVWGATLAGWATTLMFIAVYPLKKKEAWAFYSIGLSIAIWYPLDTFISFYFGVLLNCALNTVLLVLVVVPLLAMRRDLKR